MKGSLTVLPYFRKFCPVFFVTKGFLNIIFLLGAPGFTENPLKCELNQETTLDLKNIIKAMEDLAHQMMAKRKLNANFMKIIELKSDDNNNKSEVVKCNLDGSGESLL